MNNIIIGGHRGLGCTDHDFYQPLRDIPELPVENTLASIEAAFAAGCAYIETDAVMSKDGVIFTLHNVVPKDHFFFADNMPAEKLNMMNFADIQTFGTGRPGKGRIDPMSVVLDRIAALDPKTADWAVNLEIKGVQGSQQPYETNDYLERLAKVVKDSKLPVDRVLLSSFSLQNVIAMSHLLPTAKYGMLFAEKPEARGIYADRTEDASFQYLPFNKPCIDRVFSIWGEEAAKGTKLGYVHPEVMTVTPETLQVTAAHGAGLNCWAIFEEFTPERRQKYLDVVDQCKQANVPLTVITDYVPEMKSLRQPRPMPAATSGMRNG
jgi:glycerophosphoryl diester phosphodiesterase